LVQQAPWLMRAQQQSRWEHCSCSSSSSGSAYLPSMPEAGALEDTAAVGAVGWQQQQQRACQVP
jgi:hypothetical protein